MQLVEEWKEVLTNPMKAFAKLQKKASYGDAIKHLVISGLISGFISGLVLLAAGAMVSAVPQLGAIGTAIGAVGFVVSLIMSPILLLIGWIISSVILYIVAVLLNGKGSFLVQSYNIALYLAPLNVLMAIIGIIPIINLLTVLVIIYGLYLLTCALKSAHKYSTANAVLTWLIPLIIVIVLFVLAFGALLGGFLGGAISPLM